MAKEEKPLEYERRIFDTKGLAQRIDLDYLKRPNRFRDSKWRVTGLVTLVAVAAVIPLITGFGGASKAFSNGPVSRAHSVFEQNCQNCHSAAFSSVPDQACKTCHDGPPHPAKSMDVAKLRDEPRCAECHVEHRGRSDLAIVTSANCTRCHSDLTAHGEAVRLKSTSISSFKPGKHPEFSAASMPDARPLKLNHAAHMPAQPKKIRNIELPAKCTDCHQPDPNNLRGNLLPVTFEQNCRTCHRNELEFDVYQVLGPNSMPAPHSKDTKLIHEYIVGSYQRAIESDRSLLLKPLGRDLDPMPGREAWLQRVVRDSEEYLYSGRKCLYCHEFEGQLDGYPVVKKVNKILGRYVAGKADGSAWLERGEFSHRAHRAVDCASCHTDAKASTKTADILIPKMIACEPCHSQSSQSLGYCSECHLYHNKSKERDKDRRTIEQLVATLNRRN